MVRTVVNEETHRLGNTLDVVTKDLTVTLGTTPVHNDDKRKLSATKQSKYRTVTTHFPRPFPPLPRPDMLFS